MCTWEFVKKTDLMWSVFTIHTQTSKGQEEILGDNGYVIFFLLCYVDYLDCGNGFTGEYICQDPSNCIL